MARLSRIESRARTREQLLQAARTLFVRQGYAATSVDVVAETAGYSKGAFYSNFDSKEDLFLELLEQHMAEEASVSAGFLDGGSSVDAVIDRIARRYAEDADDAEWCLLSIEFALHASRSETFAARHREVLIAQHKRVSSIILQVSERARSSVADPVAAAATFIALRQGLALDRNLPRPTLSVGAARKALVDWMRATVSHQVHP